MLSGAIVSMLSLIAITKDRVSVGVTKGLPFRTFKARVELRAVDASTVIANLLTLTFC